MDGGEADALHDFLIGQAFRIVQVLLHQVVVLGSDSFNHFIMHLLRLGQELGGDLLLADVLAVVIVVHFGLHANQVDDTAEAGFLADGKLDGNCVGAQALAHHADNAHEVRTHDVHFVDVSNAGHVILGGLTPHRLALGLHAAFGAEDRHGTVQHAQAALHFHGEVHVAGSVDDVDPVAKPLASSGGRLNGDAALLFLGHKVHGGCALMDLAYAVHATCVKQDAFRGCGLAGIDVRHDADVAYLFKRMASGHGMRNLLV